MHTPPYSTIAATSCLAEPDSGPHQLLASIRKTGRPRPHRTARACSSSLPSSLPSIRRPSIPSLHSRGMCHYLLEIIRSFPPFSPPPSLLSLPSASTPSLSYKINASESSPPITFCYLHAVDYSHRARPLRFRVQSRYQYAGKNNMYATVVLSA